MLLPSIYWVEKVFPLRLALMPRPRGGEDLKYEIEAWRNEGLHTVVSLLERSEVSELELKTEADLCGFYGIRFLSYPIKDRGTPSSRRETLTLLLQLQRELLEGRAVAIHCRAGIGRTALIAGCLINMLAVPDLDVFETLSDARGVHVPDTTEQVEWVNGFERWRKSAVNV